MDILLIDPPHIVLKNVPTDRGYNVGPASLAAYLRQNGISTALLTGDLLTDYRPPNPLISLVREWKMTVRDLAKGQRLIAAAVADDSHPVWLRIEKIVTDSRPLAVGISYLTPLKPVVEKVAALVKGISPDIKVIVGSFHPTLCPDDAMSNPDIDFAVMGEGEVPLLALMREIRKPEPIGLRCRV
jgi:radical SAM superfamily enzyme YgiQ (UPF0313 family)